MLEKKEREKLKERTEFQHTAIEETHLQTTVPVTTALQTILHKSDSANKLTCEQLFLSK